MESSDKEQGNKKITEVKTFPVPFAVKEIKENITITTNTPSKHSQEQILNEALILHSEEKIQKAVKHYENFIAQGFKDHRVFFNYGKILKAVGKLKEAELSIRQAIRLKPDFAMAHSNLGNILIALGKSKEAELFSRKATELNPNCAIAHANLGGILLELGKIKEAESSTRKAIEMNPESAQFKINLSICQLAIGNINASLNSIELANKLKPNDKLINSLKAILKGRAKNKPKSLRIANIRNKLFAVQSNWEPIVFIEMSKKI